MVKEEEGNGTQDAQIDTIRNLISPLINAMEALTYMERHFHPPQLSELVTNIAHVDQPLREGLEAFRKTSWPTHLEVFAQRIEAAANAICSGFTSLRQAAGALDGTVQAYKGIRQNHRAFAALYPLSHRLPPINRFFLDGDSRRDQVLVEKLANADNQRKDLGIIHIKNESNSRGGYSMYIPEYYDDQKTYPLIVALHGGSGHGRDFIWSWVRQARSQGAIIISPSSIQRSWSLMEPEADTLNINRMMLLARDQYNIDQRHVLLTGMSDGGTFTFISGLNSASPFTHLAPIAASFHPMLLEIVDTQRIKGLPIYLIHGALDWIFPIDIARTARDTLNASRANLTYREISDLSHTYPNDENKNIMDWFLQ